MSEIELVSEDPRHLVGIRRSVHVSDLPAFYSEVLPKVMGWLQAHGIAPETMPMAMWCGMDMEAGVADVHAGCIVGAAVEADGEVTPGMTAGGELLRYTHRGPYSEMGKAWQRVYGHAAELGRTPGAGWEIYVDDPTQVPEAELRTVIHLPLMPVC